jgi:hypothetical protein
MKGKFQVQSSKFKVMLSASKFFKGFSLLTCGVAGFFVILNGAKRSEESLKTRCFVSLNITRRIMRGWTLPTDSLKWL